MTGINLIYYDIDSLYNFPSDPNIARIGGRKNARYDPYMSTKCVAARIGRQPAQYKGKQLGFIIHAHYWVLFCRTTRTSPTEIKLDKFIKSPRSQWHESKLKGLFDENIRRRTFGLNRALQKLEFECDIYQNPLIIPALQEVITHATNRHFTSRDYFSKFPIGVTCLISEWVCPIGYTLSDILNMRNMLLAFGWDMPDWFWRRRLPKDFFFELDILRESSSRPRMGLQILRLGVMRLTLDRQRYPHSGLANRERIHKNIVAIKKGVGNA